MSIRTTVTLPTPDEPNHVVKITVDNKGGGGGTSFQANITGSFASKFLTLKTDATGAYVASPRPSSVATANETTTVTWSNRTVQDSGTDFQFTVVCDTTQSSTTDVTGWAEKTADKTASSDTKKLSCPAPPPAA